MFCYHIVNLESQENKSSRIKEAVMIIMIKMTLMLGLNGYDLSLVFGEQEFTGIHRNSQCNMRFAGHFRAEYFTS
jgi:hypothetical protein